MTHRGHLLPELGYSEVSIAISREARVRNPLLTLGVHGYALVVCNVLHSFSCFRDISPSCTPQTRYIRVPHASPVLLPIDARGRACCAQVLCGALVACLRPAPPPELVGHHCSAPARSRSGVCPWPSRVARCASARNPRVARPGHAHATSRLDATSPTVDEELNCGAGVLASTVRCATVSDGAWRATGAGG